jgi:cation diffusion facilitator CzcD-associated flavoprotein CzcO
MPTSRVTRETDPSALSVTATSDETQKKIYEMTPEIKNLLLTKNPPSALYRDLHNNTATELSELPGFHYPAGTPTYVPHRVVLDYFQGYAKHFDLIPLCAFNTSVDLVQKKQGAWELVLSKYDVYASGMVREQKWRESFDAVVVATGQHRDPFVPEFQDLTAFSKIYPDKLMHSDQYRRPEDFKDKVT